MKDEVKVSFYTKRNEEKKDGACPVMARLTVGGTEAVFSAKLTVPAGMWASGRAKGKSQTAVEINRQLDEIRASALAHWRELSAVKEKVTAEDVKNLLLGMASGQETLLAYFRAHNEKFDKRVGVNRREGSARSYWNALNHVARFISEKYHLSDIPFTALDRSFIEKFDLHLRVDCKLTPGTIVVQTVRLGTIINRAIADGIITAHPFAGYEPESPERKPKISHRQGGRAADDHHRRVGTRVRSASRQRSGPGEFRALLSLYNIGVEDVQGTRAGQAYRGLLYTALDGNGQKAEVTPIKSSLLGKSCGYDALEKLMERSGTKIAGDNSREQTRRRVADAFSGSPTGGELRERLGARHIDLYIRRNEGGRITGATFIDHENRTVLNGSRLGKEYSANVLQERYGMGLESGAGSIRQNTYHGEHLQPTPPTVSQAPETRQARPAPRRTVVKKKSVRKPGL